MTSQRATLDAVIIGGGFYGSVVAVYLARNRGLKKVILLEKEPKLLLRASYNNQARIHNGYHYPRSFITGFRSRVNLPRFLKDWPKVAKKDFVKLYAIARCNSKVTAKQFQRFCDDIGAKIEPAESTLKQLFDPRLIEDVFSVEEYAFDATRLADWAVQELRNSGVEVHYSTNAFAISRSPSDKWLTVGIQSNSGDASSITCRYVFNCSYSGLNQFSGDFPCTQTSLKQEVTEMAIIEAPQALKDIGITVMDGPFFSMMPFPALGQHSLSHVRYTPHFSWQDKKGIDPYIKLDNYDRATRFDRMIRDVSRYLPSAIRAKYLDSLFEVKTVLVKNEEDDGRPILFEKHEELPGCYSILGGKIDNIYDIFDKLDSEEFKTHIN